MYYMNKSLNFKVFTINRKRKLLKEINVYAYPTHPNITLEKYNTLSILLK